MKNTLVGIDLAKKVIQVCVYSDKKVQSNTEMTPLQFTYWLVNSKTGTIIFEACDTSTTGNKKRLKQDTMPLSFLQN